MPRGIPKDVDDRLRGDARADTMKAEARGRRLLCLQMALSVDKIDREHVVPLAVAISRFLEGETLQ
jgi:hypothetical protein